MTASTPPKRMSAASLLSLFGAQSSPSSVSKMAKMSRNGDLRPVYHAPSESDLPTRAHQSPDISEYTSSHSPPPETQLSTDDSSPPSQDVDSASGQGATPTRALPQRSTRAQVNYGRPKKVYQKKRTVAKAAILASNTTKVKPDTARNRIRSEIATHTKVKRDAFLLAHQELFLPLLPQNNYVAKLSTDGSTQTRVAPVPYRELQVQPEHIVATMKPYQLSGLSFLTHMYDNGMPAILGDEMGLGKTLQTLSLIQHLKNMEPRSVEEVRPCLVVCPLSVLSSWMSEARKWTPQLKVLRFQGPPSVRKTLKLEAQGKIDRYGNGLLGRSFKGLDVVVTTYETFVAEQYWFKTAFVWRYAVLDEGHKIKNDKTEVARALQSLQAEYRLLLTGTPIQNNMEELYALFHWLLPEVFTIKAAEAFSEAFNLSRGKVSASFMEDSRRLLELLMLRRMKSTSGVNLDLPPKQEIVLLVPLTPTQRIWYTRLLTKAGGALLSDLFRDNKEKEQQALKTESHQLDAVKTPHIEDTDLTEDQWAESRAILRQTMADEDETKTGDWKKLMNLIMQLRKCCTHPYQLPHAQPEPYFLGDHVITASGKFMVLSKLIDELVIRRGSKILIFSGFTRTLDYCEDLLMLKGSNVHNAAFRYLRFDGSTGRARRNLAVRMFNEPSSDFKVMLISTRAGGLGLNLATASNVIFMDEDWNPQVTLQAEARAHRIGQTQPVTIYKLVSQGTVEEQMGGRIRKKLFLSAKITDSMRSIHSTKTTLKRKRVKDDSAEEEAMPQLGTSQLMALVRRGTTTLIHPMIDVTDMLSWDFETMLDKCKDRTVDHTMAAGETNDPAVDEREWLQTMEKVECAVFDGVKYHREHEKATAVPEDLDRAARRVGKNTTVMIDGFAINKESLQCKDWEAVPTFYGKDARLAEPKRAKAPPLKHQDHCQSCWEGGEMLCCSKCPRVYHVACLMPEYQAKAKAWNGFMCPQHYCADCEKNTSDAGGMIYRCRWCHNGYCEDCLDWESAVIVGDALPELNALDYGVRSQAWWIECPGCIEQWKDDRVTRAWVDKAKKRYAKLGATVDGIVHG